MDLKKLSGQDVLIIDCQATGPNPDKNHLLEIGWAIFNTCNSIHDLSDRIESYIHKIPDGFEVPGHIQRITGITKEDLSKAVPAEFIWKQIVLSINKMSGGSSLPNHAVIHFAGYETPFLRDLHKNYGANTLFPLEIICSHRVIKYLIPELPRKGLRAVAGYFNHSSSKFRRCSDHIIATAVIWNNIVGTLCSEHKIFHIEALKTWLEKNELEKKKASKKKSQGKTAGKIIRKYPMGPDKREALPDLPGIYKMLRQNGDVLYIGKAKSLKKRVTGYFQKQKKHPEHILEMLSQAKDLKTIVVSSALEAAVLESDEIKKNTPPYNIALQKGKRKIVFCSKDYQFLSPNADFIACVGPFPSEDSVVALSAITEALNTSITEFHFEQGVIQKMLSMPTEYLPDPDIFENGMKTFFQRYEKRILKKPAHEFIKWLGIRLWIEKIKKQETEELENNSVKDRDEDLDNAEEWEWTPDNIADRIEGIIRHTENLKRRGHWFSILCESVLTWQTTGKENKGLHTLSLSAGIPVFSDMYDKNRAPITFLNFSSLIQRKTNFDIIVYDRMRVITTEIRRLLSENRKVELKLNHGQTLQNSTLMKILKWV